ncbi:MAG: alpha/beta fold hydrolase [Rhodocyclaceae bacterium]|nr:alpha/beta fold hydrolase [Rhodocyclaceae bacterium]
MSAPWILYLHGFTSGPQSHKAQALQARMQQRGIGDRFVCPQLPASPKEAIRLAESLLGTRDKQVTVVGSSLGGYYATWLAEKYDLRAVLVNPAVASAISLEQYLGPQRWLYSGEEFELTREHLAEMNALYLPELKHPERFWLLAEEGDETLDYRQAVARYLGAKQTVLAGGDHSFTRWDDYLDSIIEFAVLV